MGLDNEGITMGLMDKLERGDFDSTDHSVEKVLDEILDRAELLMDAIQSDGPPMGVVLGHELEYQQGGRHLLESGFWGLLGLMFIGVPLGMIAMMLLAFLSNPSGVTPLGLICLPLLGVLAFALISMGKDVASEPFRNLTAPDPIMQVVERTWLDPVNRFIAVFSHATEEETGEQHPPEIVTAFFVDGQSTVSVSTIEPYGGADHVTPGYELVGIRGVNVKEDQYRNSHDISLPSGARLEADEIGKHISDVMGLSLVSR